ncbi:MAG: NHLP bacteriocin export ABC transporter permease/ATPase subunit [Lachnospiraceae bacterium]|nr:NHLP bacteriocin export ABC transporter permease/ATPase subunit [Lachnospiraceae bacterium]
MGWFDEQIKLRKQADREIFEDSFLEIAGAVMGKKLSAALNDRTKQAKDAIDEILKYYHVKSQEIPDGMEDINDVLEFLLRPYGIMRRSVDLDPGWEKDAAFAMMGTRTDDGSVVALIPDPIYGYTFYDSASGKRLRVTKQNEGMIDREALAFYKPFPMKKIGVPGLLKYIWENISVSDVVFFVLILAIVTLVGTLLPRINKLLFSVVVKSESMQVLFAVASYLICVIIGTQLFTAAKNLLMTKITTKLDVSVEAATMMRILSLPASFFKDYGSGELSSRSQHIKSLVQQILDMGFTTGLTSVFSLIYIGQIFVFAPALVVPSVIITLITVAVSIISALMQMGISRRLMEIESKEQGMGYALISGIQKIKLAGAEKRAFARWGRLYSREAELLYSPPLFIKINSVITTAVSLIGTLVLYYVAVVNGVQVADYFAFNSAYGMVSAAFLSLAGVALELAQIKPTLEMAKPILEAVPEIAEDKQVVEKLSGGIELSNITFRYKENMPPVLNNLSLKIRPGQYVAIVGKTGCGKSTLMRIMLGFETPQKGAVYYDGKDLSRIDLKSLRRKIGTVIQNGKLFNGDIFSNIVISAPWLTLDDAWEAAEMAGMAEDIRDMPMGMFTMISEGQGGISGGQKQRLMIARAVAPKPRILMFDEATSALDNLTQKKVSDSLDALKCTRIVIAHRLSTIRNCNRIIVMDGGRIIEDGTYDELIAKNGFFAELVKRQRIDQEGPEKDAGKQE